MLSTGKTQLHSFVLLQGEAKISKSFSVHNTSCKSSQLWKSSDMQKGYNKIISDFAFSLQSGEMPT